MHVFGGDGNLIVGLVPAMRTAVTTFHAMVTSRVTMVVVVGCVVVSSPSFIIARRFICVCIVFTLLSISCGFLCMCNDIILVSYSLKSVVLPNGSVSGFEYFV